MTDELRNLIEKARHVQMTPEEQEQQIISFVYGNLHYHDDSITREQVARWFRLLRAENPSNPGPESV